MSEPPQPASGPSPAPDLERWLALARAVLAAEGVPEPVEVGLTFVDADEMAEFNATHLGHEGPTDVLSFPLDLADGLPRDDGAAGAPLMAGDIVICAEVAARNAPTHAGSLEDELALLVVHGVLHLLGHDHAEPGERAAMQARERALLAALHGPLAGDPWAALEAEATS